MKFSQRALSNALLLAWMVVLAGPAIPVVQDVYASLAADQGDDMSCCCGTTDLCACDDDMACNTADAADANQATCVRIPVLFSGVALEAGSFSLVLPHIDGQNVLAETIAPDQIVRAPLDHPPQAA